MDVGMTVLDADRVGTFASTVAERDDPLFSFGLCGVLGISVSMMRLMPRSAVSVG
jgi:hypothetical protein